MSKIEEALKKATQRQKNTQGIQVGPLQPRESRPGFQDQMPLPEARDRTVEPEKKKTGPRQLLDAPALKVTEQKLVTLQQEKSHIAEEYNKLRSSIIALTQGEQFHNTLLVTSCASEEGKSLTALNLAISLAREQDHTVLLVDADLRRPSLHRYLNFTPEIGLVQCLRDQAPLEKALVKTGLGKLVVLPAGESLKDPLDLLSSQRMRELVSELKLRYSERYVIFDTPPALPFADAGVLADMVDGILFVVREGRAGKEDVRRTLEDFKQQNLLGVVFNDATRFSKKQSYYYYY